MGDAGSWSVYWYNGLIVSSEIARGLDIFELVPSAFLSQNEIDAAKSVKLDYLNTQGQPKFVWPASFALARAYVDQLERSGGLSESRIASTRRSLSDAEKASGAARREALTKLAAELRAEATTKTAMELEGTTSGSHDGGKVRKLADAVRDLAATTATLSPRPPEPAGRAAPKSSLRSKA